MRRLGKERGKILDKVVKIAGAVNDTMYLYSLSTNGVEGEIGFDVQDTITVFPKFGMSR